VVPIKESHTLEVSWDIPPTEKLYRKAPTNYLSHLLGHEGAGSAFALLKARGLATALSAGAPHLNRLTHAVIYSMIRLCCRPKAALPAGGMMLTQRLVCGLARWNAVSCHTMCDCMLLSPA